MSKLKDWKLGECRIKLHVVLESGTQLEYYLPHCTPAQGARAIALATEIVKSRPDSKAYPKLNVSGCNYRAEDDKREWKCDHCERRTPKGDLKAVPANAVCMFNNLCSECRDKLGWTDEKLEAHWAKVRAIAKDFMEAGPQGFDVNVEQRTPCPVCKGTGFNHGSCCRKCEGSMSITVNKEGFEKP